MRTIKEYVPYEKNVKVTVNEHRAPTDKSVELLNEMTEKVKQNIIESIQVKDNIINGAVIYFQNNMFPDKVRFVVKFQLNGVDHTVEGEIDRWELMGASTNTPFKSEKVLRVVYQKVAGLIALDLLKDFVKSK